MPHSANGCLYNGLYVPFLPTTLMPGRSAASKKLEFSVLLAFGGADSPTTIPPVARRPCGAIGVTALPLGATQPVRFSTYQKGVYHPAA